MSTIKNAAQEYVKANVDYENNRILRINSTQLKALIERAYIAGAWSIQNIRIQELQQETQQLELQVGLTFNNK